MNNTPLYVDLVELRELIRIALREDIGTGDVTTESTIPVNTRARGVFKAKESGVLAGIQVMDIVFDEVDPNLKTEWTCVDGAPIQAGQILGSVQGSARSILAGERLALNYLQRMSGIATLTRSMCDELAGSNSRLLDTRKTAPGLRMLDKWSVRLGGGLNHRVGLFDMILIKENHIAAAGGIEKALDGAVRRTAGTDLRIEIEVRSLDELRQVLAHGGAHRVMLDNFVLRGPDGPNTTLLTEALEIVVGRLETEASGNVTLDTLRAIGKTGVDFISSGALTHSVRALDVSLLVTIDR